MTGIINDSLLLKQLRGYNPWWTGQQRSTPRFRRVAFRKCLDRLVDRDSRRAVMLSGPRRVGKSTILLQIADALIEEHGRDPRAILYVSLDDNLLKLAPLDDLIRIYRETMYPEGSHCFLLLDEVHYAFDWDQHIKTLVDHHPEYTILATGSASLEQRARVAHSGVGRWVTIPIPTLSFFEFLQLRDEQPDAVDGSLRIRDLVEMSDVDRAGLAAILRPTLPLFRKYLLVGGFPETARMEDVAECQRLLREDIVDRVLKRDISVLFNVRNVADLEKLFLYVCLHSGRIVNVSSCSKELGVPRSTVDSYLEVLTEANLLYRLRPLELGGKKLLKAKSKYYLVDAALRNAILLSGQEALDDPSELGRIVETAVLRHLFAFYYRETPKVGYWIDSATQREVDIVVKGPQYTLPFEVKYRESAGAGESMGLSDLCSNAAIPIGFQITKSEGDFGVDALDSFRIVRIPAHVFTYVIGQAEQIESGA